MKIKKILSFILVVAILSNIVFSSKIIAEAVTQSGWVNSQLVEFSISKAIPRGVKYPVYLVAQNTGFWGWKEASKWTLKATANNGLLWLDAENGMIGDEMNNHILFMNSKTNTAPINYPNSYNFKFSVLTPSTGVSVNLASEIYINDPAYATNKSLTEMKTTINLRDITNDDLSKKLLETKEIYKNIIIGTKAGNVPISYKAEIETAINGAEMILDSSTETIDILKDAYNKLYDASIIMQNKKVNVADVTPYPFLDATLISENVPEKMVAGESYDVSITYKNSGAWEWSPNYYQTQGIVTGFWNGLEFESPDMKHNNALNDQLIDVNTKVPSLSNYTYNFKVKAPNESGTSKYFNITPTMYGYSNAFGEFINKLILIVPKDKMALDDLIVQTEIMLSKAVIGPYGSCYTQQVWNALNLAKDNASNISSTASAQEIIDGYNTLKTAINLFKSSSNPITKQSDSFVVEHNIPSTMVRGEEKEVYITFKNVGTAQWNTTNTLNATTNNQVLWSNFDFGGISNSLTDQQVNMTQVNNIVGNYIEPLGKYTFKFTIKAPVGGDNIVFSSNMSNIYTGGAFGQKFEKTIALTTVTKENLSGIITQANNTLDTTERGTCPGQYSISKGLFLTSKVQAGVLVRDNSSSTDLQIAVAYYNISDAIGKYTASKITDVNIYAELISENIPTDMVRGKNYNISITYKNRGLRSWNENEMFRLGATANNNIEWGNRVNMNPITNSDPIGYGETYTFQFTVTAPVTGDTVVFSADLLIELVAWFGMPLTKNITLRAADKEDLLGIINDASTMLSSVETGNKIGQYTQANKDILSLEIDKAILAYNTITAPYLIEEAAEILSASIDTFLKTKITVVYNDSELISFIMPDKMIKGLTYDASITFKNKGSWFWADMYSFRLNATNNNQFQFSEFKFGGVTGGINNQYVQMDRQRDYYNVKTNEEYTFNFKVTAPTTGNSATFESQLCLYALNQYFGDKATRTVTLEEPNFANLSVLIGKAQGLLDKAVIGSGKDEYDRAMVERFSSQIQSARVDLNKPEIFRATYVSLYDAIDMFISSVNSTDNISAKLVSMDIPDEMVKGKSYKVSLTFRNSGLWYWASSLNYRLGTTASNQFLWSEFENGGGAVSEKDGRAFLNNITNAAPIMQGDKCTFNFTVTAPVEGNEAIFGAQMVVELVSWFPGSVFKTVKLKDPTKSDLLDFINDTEKLLSSSTIGDISGDFTLEEKEKLILVLNSAKAVYNNSSSTNKEISDIAIALIKAKNAFLKTRKAAIDKDIRIIKSNIPDKMVKGKKYSVSVTVENRGNWYVSDKTFDRLAGTKTNQFAFNNLPDGGEQTALDYQHIFLVKEKEYNMFSQYTFNFDVVAPYTDSGNAVFSVQMFNIVLNKGFGESLTKNIELINPNINDGNDTINEIKAFLSTIQIGEQRYKYDREKAQKVITLIDSVNKYIKSGNVALMRAELKKLNEAYYNLIFAKHPLLSLDYDIVSIKMPDVMVIGKQYDAEITLKNLGMWDWAAKYNYNLGAFETNQFVWSGFEFKGLTNVPNNQRVFMNPATSLNPIKMEQNYTFKFKVRAPLEGKTAKFSAKMLIENYMWYGEVIQKDIKLIMPTKKDFKELIDEAQKMYDTTEEGIHEGQYPKENREALRLAIVAAKGEYDNKNNSIDSLVFAYKKLAKTMMEYEKSIIPVLYSDSIVVNFDMPDEMVKGKSYDVSITLKNIGEWGWADYFGNRLVATEKNQVQWCNFENGGEGSTFLKQAAYIDPKYTETNYIKKNMTYTFVFTVTAPSNMKIVNFEAQLINTALNKKFGEPIFKKITLTGGLKPIKAPVKNGEKPVVIPPIVSGISIITMVVLITIAATIIATLVIVSLILIKKRRRKLSANIETNSEGENEYEV